MKENCGRNFLGGSKLPPVPSDSHAYSCARARTRFLSFPQPTQHKHKHNPFPFPLPGQRWVLKSRDYSLRCMLYYLVPGLCLAPVNYQVLEEGGLVLSTKLLTHLTILPWSMQVSSLKTKSRATHRPLAHLSRPKVWHIQISFSFHTIAMDYMVANSSCLQPSSLSSWTCPKRQRNRNQRRLSNVCYSRFIQCHSYESLSNNNGLLTILCITMGIETSVNSSITDCWRT